jgi:PD-(D/E)XK nuclease superfamily protein
MERSGYHPRTRSVNRRVQGDIGEASAIEWLTSKGALVWLPFGHSPDVDLIAEVEDRLLRIQVKTSTLVDPRPGDEPRWKLAIATHGGNRSWSGLTKHFNPARIDYLFALVGDGRRWFIPAECVEASRELTLGGCKYSEFEVETGVPFEGLVYPEANTNTISHPILGECQSGQMDVTVNHTAMPTQVRILPPPSTASAQVLLRPKRQATIPRRPCEAAGLVAGDRLRVSADGPGRIVLERIERRSS